MRYKVQAEMITDLYIIVEADSIGSVIPMGEAK